MEEQESTTVTLTVKQGPGTKCPVGDTEYDATGKSTADTTGSVHVGGKVAAKVCINAAGSIELVPGTKATFA